MQEQSAQGSSNEMELATKEKALAFKVIKTYVHNKNFFTQGFFYEDGKIYEGTGGFGSSSIYVYRLDANNILQNKKLPKQYFGEGITKFRDKIFQLTWQNHVCFVYDNKTLQVTKQFNLPNEGWGITHNDTSLIVSDGTDKIFFLNPSTFKLEKTIIVSNSVGSVNQLNELEYINGYIFANRWMTNQIFKIDAQTGKVIGVLDLSDVLNSMGFDNSSNRDAVLNGIAYNKKSNTLFLTGKLWPIIFEIQLL